MSLRQELLDELLQIEHGRGPKSMGDLWDNRKARKRVEEICNILHEEVCRNCDKHYDGRKARGDYKGFCSAKCQHQRAKELGYRKGVRTLKGTLTEFDVLKRANCVGSVHVCK